MQQTYLRYEHIECCTNKNISLYQERSKSKRTFSIHLRIKKSFYFLISNLYINFEENEKKKNIFRMDTLEKS